MLLLDLPDEILSHVLESCSQLTDTKGRLGPSAPGRQDIRNFGRTCRQGYRLTEPYLHRSFLLRKAKDVASFLPLLSSDPDGKKVKHIRDLALVPLTDETSSEYRDVAKSVAALPNLEQLIIETPYRTHTAIQDSQDPFEVFQSDLGGLDDLGSGLPGCPIPSWSHRLVTCKNPDPFLTASSSAMELPAHPKKHNLSVDIVTHPLRPIFVSLRTAVQRYQGSSG